MTEKQKTAPVKRSVMLATMTLVLCAAALVGALLYTNATTLRGTVSRSALADITPETLGATAEIWDVNLKHDVLKLSGALARKDIDTVDLRVGLIWKPEGGEEEDAVTLLNTQMVRLDAQTAQRLGGDDHSGFAAAVKLERLPHYGENGQYRTVLVSKGQLIDIDELGPMIIHQERDWYWSAERRSL